MKNIYPRNVYQIREVLFDKLYSFSVKYTSERKFFKNLAIFEFESICFQEENFRNTNTTTWIGKHVPISLSFSSNLVEDQFSWATLILISSLHLFLELFKNLASQSKAKIKNLLHDIGTTKKIKLGNNLEKLTQRHIRRDSGMFDMSQDECDNEIWASTQLLQIQKINYLIFKNLWNVIVMFYLCLVSTVQNTISP